MLIVLLTGVLLSVSACSNSSSTDASQSDNQKNEQQKSDNDNQKNEKQDEQSEADQMEDDSDKKEDQTVQEDKSAEITIYTSNDDATAFVSDSVKIEKSVLPSDVQVLKCDKQTVDGVESLEIDFNEAFGAYVCSMGTTGEYYTIGSVVNTFLDAYGCEKIKITVEGNTLETGHAEYPGYMNRFE